MVDIAPGPGPDSSTPARREQLRHEHQVRLVTVEEEGYGVSRLPAGVYGFTYAPLGETPLFRNQAYHSFEVHKTAGEGWHLLAFVTPSDAEAIRVGSSQLEIHVFPDPWQQATELVSVPASRLAAKRLLPSREPGNWVAVTVYPPHSV